METLEEVVILGRVWCDFIGVALFLNVVFGDLGLFWGSDPRRSNE